MKIGSCPRFIIAGLFMAISAGCASSKSSIPPQEDFVRINREQASTITSLDKEVQRLNAEIHKLLQNSQADLEQTKNDLESSLSGSLESGDLEISMEAKGLVVTVLDRVLFSPGRVELKPSAQETLRTVAQVLNGEVRDHMIYVEGHTDNEPIRRSSWRSNWELSTARATEVIHFFIEEASVNPNRLAATGYGEFHPVVSNDTLEGRMKNRRVEIVVSPKKIGE